MTILIKATWANRIMGANEKSVESDAALSAMEAALLAGLPEEDIGFIEIEGKLVPPETLLNDGDVLVVYTQIIGG